jgi:hypothetical protein
MHAPRRARGRASRRRCATRSRPKGQGPPKDRAPRPRPQARRARPPGRSAAPGRTSSRRRRRPGVSARRWPSSSTARWRAPLERAAGEKAGAWPDQREDAARLSSPKSARENRHRSERLTREAEAFAGRLGSLFAEARDDEIESLRALAEDSRGLSEDIRSLRRSIDGRTGRAESEDVRPGGQAAEEPEELEEERRTVDEAQLRGLAALVRGLEDDAKGLRERLERRAPELLDEALDGRKGEVQLGDVLTATERELLELARRLSRNQPPRPTNSLGAGALAYQVVGDGVIQKLERIIKQRDFRPPEDETAPEEFRDLVEKYFRALSEDGGE